MKVSINKLTRPKLVAVIGAMGDGFFTEFSDNSGNKCVRYIGTVYKTEKTLSMSEQTLSLFDLLQEDITRMPVYEGDTITLQF